MVALLGLTLSGSLMAQEHAVPLKQDAEEKGEAEAPSPEEQALKLEIESRLSQFSDDFTQLQMVGSISLAPDAKLGLTNSLDVMWNTYTQAQQMDIANDEDLMTMVANIEALKQSVKDTLDARDAMVKAVSDFASADQFIISQVAIYKKLYQRAYKLSLVKNLAPQLEKAKARETLIFEKLQASYDAAKASAELVPTLQPRMNVLDEQFVVMKSVSEKVQALEYKPIFQRIKDYVMGLAAVSIILLFFTMMVARYKAYKDKLANMKKMKEMMNNQGKDSKYPMI